MTDKQRIERYRKPTICPNCKSKTIARIQYGEPAPSPKFFRQLANGEIVIGGCLLYGDDPTWTCTACGQNIHKVDK